MSRPVMFLLRAMFLAYFTLNAWNTLRDLNRFHLSFRENYVRFEKAFTAKTHARFPSFMASNLMDKYSAQFLRITAWLQILLCGLALLFVPGLTALIGLIYFLLAMVQHNIADFHWGMKLHELEPFMLSVALFMAAIYMGLLGAGRSSGSMKETLGGIAGSGIEQKNKR